MNVKKFGRAVLSILCCTLICTLSLPRSAQAAENAPTCHVALTDAEKEYVRQHDPIQVQMYDGMGYLLCRYDADEERYKGIVVDALDLLSERTGLTFVYVPAEEMAPWDYLDDHPDTLSAPFFCNDIITTHSGILTLEPIVEGSVVGFSRHNETIQLDSAFTLAVPVGDYRCEEALRQYFPKAHVVPCFSHLEGLNMLRDGEVDLALVNEIIGAYRLQSPYFKDLQVSNAVDIPEDMTLALSRDSSPELISILNKGIASLGTRDIAQIMVNNTAEPYDLSFAEWLYQYRAGIVLGFVVVLSTAAWMVYFWKQKQQRAAYKQELLLAEERYKLDMRYQERIFYQANFDALTGLYNKTHFIEKANEWMQASPDAVFTFLRLNFKRLKMVNELYGMDAGDAVLCQIADYMREHVGKNGVYGRLYADQFAACMEVDRKVLEKHARSCVGYVEYNGQKIRVEVNVGVYIDTRQCRDATLALDYAQIALQNEAWDGNKHYFYYQDAYLETMRVNQQITNCMEGALRSQQFQIYLQPQFDISAQKLVGAEALVRWVHPVGGMIPPDRFIPVFESNGFVCQLDAYICDKVCALLARWRDQGKQVPISVNLSWMDLEDPDLLSRLQGTLDKYGIPIQYLHLEITESTYAKNENTAFRTIQQLRDAGFCLEMDDFGSGYSSLNMLKEIPVDVLKLDMKFFDGERRMDRGGNIIEAIVKLAHSLGLIVVAEGVETEREANFLRSVSCNIVQGYLYGRPEPVEEFEARLAASAIGEKKIDVSNDSSLSNLYWEVEKCNLLLRRKGVTILDYDPFLDHAIFSGPDQNGEQGKIGIAEYTKRVLESPHIHPDSREPLRACLKNGQQRPVELEFQGRKGTEGPYEWLHAVFYYYKNGTVLNRIIAIIKKKE